MRYCQKCGNALPDNARFCTGCGTKQDIVVESAESAAQPAEPAAAQIPSSPPQSQAPPPRAAAPEAAPKAAPSAGTIDGGRAFTYFSKDPTWMNKVLIGGLILIIPIVGFLVLMGYQLRLIKNVAEGRELPLPEWEMGEQLKTGFILFLYYLGFAIITGIPLGILTNFVPIIGPLFGLVGNIALGFYMIAAVSIIGAEEDFGAMFQFKRVLNIATKNLVPLLLVFLFLIVTGIIALSGLIGLIIGVLFTVVISTMMYAHLIGQFYTVARAPE